MWMMPRLGNITTARRACRCPCCMLIRSARRLSCACRCGTHNSFLFYVRAAAERLGAIEDGLLPF